MTIVYRSAAILTLLMAGSVCALAGEITWTLTDVAFDNGNVANGWFTTDMAVTQFDSFSITVTGPASNAAFTAAIMVDSYLPGTIGFANSDWSEYVDLYLSSPLTSAGGPVQIASGFDCPNDARCGVLVTDVFSGASVEGAASPEPSAFVLIAAGLGVLGLTLRRKLVRVS